MLFCCSLAQEKHWPQAASPASQAVQPQPANTTANARATTHAKAGLAIPTNRQQATNQKTKSNIGESHTKKPTAPLVPPPPPDTPALIEAPDGLFGSLPSFELMSLDAMKDKQKELTSQLNDAQQELKQRQEDADATKGKAKQFEALYTEGVISKRELEVAQKDATEVDRKIDQAKMRIRTLQSLLKNLNTRMQVQQNRTAKLKTLSAKSHKKR